MDLYYCQIEECPFNVGDIFGPFLLRQLLNNKDECIINVRGPSKDINKKTLMIGIKTDNIDFLLVISYFKFTIQWEL